jgi:hypothetical protein
VLHLVSYTSHYFNVNTRGTSQKQKHAISCRVLHQNNRRKNMGLITRVENSAKLDLFTLK